MKTYLLFKDWLALTQQLSREAHPSVESRCSPFAPTARFNAHGVCNPLDGIAQADFFIDEKARKTNAVWRPLGFPAAILRLDFPFHRRFAPDGGVIA
jgi:hypothetical protein